jgi:Domain of unknown function (DUF4189)
MTKHKGKKPFPYRALSVSFMMVVLILSAGPAHAQTPDQNYNACVDALGYVGCDNLGKPNVPQRQIILHWAALAISPTTLRPGGSHGQNSVDAAEQTALANCRRQGPTDCKVLQWARNECQALAISYPEKKYGWSDSLSRAGAAAQALAECRSVGGRSCQVIVAPCAGDDARWSSPLPLPPGGTTATVDARTVGTWELLINPGVWVWRIAANGTFESHSEAGDGAPPQAGTISASGGKWSIHALNNGNTDGGTYTFQGPATLVATGKLGTGAWHRVVSRPDE